MTTEQFCYWLQGFMELNPSMATPSAEQMKMIREHLAEVFVKKTPPFHVSVGGLLTAQGSHQTIGTGQNGPSVTVSC